VGAKDINELGKLVKTKIAGLPGFGMSETFVIFSEIKSDQGWPIKGGKHHVRSSESFKNIQRKTG